MKVNYTKELLEEKIKNCYSFAELCRRLGLNPEGSNHKGVSNKESASEETQKVEVG